MTLSRPASKIRVYIAGVLRSDLTVISVTQNIGGGHIDTAVLRVSKLLSDASQAHSTSGYILQDTSLYAWAVNAPCRIIRTDWNGVERLIHTGRVVSVNADMSNNGEVVTLTSRLDPHMFGRLAQYPKRGARVDGYIGERCEVMGDITFNPTIGNVTVPNMFGGLYPAEGREPAEPEWIDPMSFPKRLYGQSLDVYRRWSPFIGYWSITDALFYIMRACTLDNGCLYVMPPDSESIKQMIDPYDLGVDRLEELTVDLTDSVPVMLDKVLSGTEYTWYIDYDWTPLPRITFMNRAYPARIQSIAMQRYGKRVHSEIGMTQVKQYSFQYDVANESANAVGVLYGPLKVEVSVPLYPAWYKELDSMKVSDLTKSYMDDDSPAEVDRVWRDWVANETGDYTTRLSERNLVPGAARDLLIEAFRESMEDSRVWATDPEIDKDFMKRYPYMRLPFGHCLTQGSDGSSVGDGTGGVVIQYWLAGESTEWRPIEELFSSSFSASTLKSECGVRFSTTEKPLEKLMSMRSVYGPEWARFFWVRATGTINFGKVLYAERKLYWDLGETFIADRKCTVVDRGGKYQLSDIQDGSLFYDKVFVSKEKFAATSDDSPDAWKFASRAAVAYSSAKCSGSMVLEGVDTPLQPLGLCVSKFDVRNVDISTCPAALARLTPAGGRYPLVIGVEYDIQSQETRLTLDTYRVNPQKFMRRSI